MLAAIATTAFTTNWIWNKVDALTPVELPSAGAPLPTVSPDTGARARVENGLLYNTLGDTMPVLPMPPWTSGSDPLGYRGVGLWLTVHVRYDGKNTWANTVTFGNYQPRQSYRGTPAGIRKAAITVGSRMIEVFYRGSALPIKGSVTHRDFLVDGHRAHELVARVPVSEPGLHETTSIIAIAVIDRGDGTAAVVTGDFAGSRPQWLSVWRQAVAEVAINR